MNIQAYNEGRQHRASGLPMLCNPYLNFRDCEEEAKSFDRGYMDEDKALRTGDDAHVIAVLEEAA